MDTYISLIGLCMGVLSFLGGLVFWYRGAVEKRYAASRDFEHLRRNYEQLSSGVDQLHERVDERSEQMMLQVLEIKGMLYAFLGERTAGGSITTRKRD